MGLIYPRTKHLRPLTGAHLDLLVPLEFLELSEQILYPTAIPFKKPGLFWALGGLSGEPPRAEAVHRGDQGLQVSLSPATLCVVPRLGVLNCGVWWSCNPKNQGYLLSCLTLLGLGSRVDPG